MKHGIHFKNQPSMEDSLRGSRLARKNQSLDAPSMQCYPANSYRATRSIASGSSPCGLRARGTSSRRPLLSSLVLTTTYSLERRIYAETEGLLSYCGFRGLWDLQSPTACTCSSSSSSSAGSSSGLRGRTARRTRLCRSGSESVAGRDSDARQDACGCRASGGHDRRPFHDGAWLAVV